MSITNSVYNQGAQFRVTAIGDASNAGDVINVYEFMMMSGSNVDGETVLTDLEIILRGLYVLVSIINNVVTVWRGLRVEELDGANSTGLIPFVGGEITGLLTNDPLPSGVAALINFPTGVKNVIPKKYFGVLDESLVGGSGNFGTTAQNDIGDIAAYLVATHVANQNWHYSYNSTKAGGPIILDQASVGNIPAYQRRRKFRVGS